MTTHIDAEIQEQAACVQRVLAADPDPWEDFVDAVPDHVPLVLLARGSSDNAARYARYAAAIQVGRLTSLAMPSVVTVYGRRDLVQRPTGIVAISQSGQSPDLIATLQAAREYGTPSLVITNEPASPLAQVGDHVVDLACGPERSVAATKTYTATLAAVARLVTTLGGPRIDAARLVDAMEQAIATDLPDDAASLQISADHAMVTARGYHYATAHEAALKLQELTGRTAQPYSTADFAHGPMAALTRSTALVVIAPSGRTGTGIKRVLDQARDRGARTLVVTGAPAQYPDADATIPLPTGIPEWLAPLTTIVPLQRLAVRTAAALGVDVDNPHGLSKVTQTR